MFDSLCCLFSLPVRFKFASEMRRAGSRAIARLIVAVLCIFLTGQFVVAQTGRQSLVGLKPGERELAGGEIHTYRLTLTPGQFIRGVFEQRGIDVSVTLLGPDGARLVMVDSPVGSWGPEPVFFEVGEAGGVYTLEVRPVASDAAPGRYEFTLLARLVTPQDRLVFPAEKLFAEGTNLLAAKTPDAFQQSIAKYEEALRQFRTTRDRRGEVTTLSTIGAVYSALGQMQLSLGYLFDAIEIHRALGNQAAEGYALNQVALVYFALGDRDNALDYFNRALVIFRALDESRTAGYTLNNIGFVYDSMGDTRLALDNFNSALPLFRKVGDRRGEAYTLNNIGLAYDELSERAKARESFQQSLGIFDDIDDCQEIAPEYSNLALDLHDTGDKQKALDYLNRALSLQQGFNDRRGEATTLNNIGFVYNSLGDKLKALDYLNRALILHRELKNRLGEGDTHSNLMFLWRGQNRAGIAIYEGKQAVNAYQEVRSTIPQLDKEAQKTFIKSRETTYRQLAEMLIESRRLPEALQVLEMLKEAEYFDFARRGGEAAPGSTVALSPEEIALGKHYQDIEDQIVVRGRKRSELLAKPERTEEENQQLAKLDLDANAAGFAFQKLLDQLSVELENTKDGAAKVYQLGEATGMSEDLRELGEGAVALYTVVGEDKYRVILITPDVRVAREYPIKATELYKKVADFIEVLQNPELDPRPRGQELYRILIEPIAKDLRDANAQTLMWSLDGVLRYVPIAALYDGRQYVVEQYRNVIFTPASKSRLKDVPSPKWTGLAFGVSKQHGDFGALPAVPDELHGIISETGGTPDQMSGVLPGKVLLDETFTEDSLRAGLRARQHKLVHIASHFQFLPGNEANSFLLLGDGQRLSLAKLKIEQNIFGGVELLTLSACETATSGAGSDGKEVEGFAMQAQRQGAKAVIASLWRVADASTRQLMQRFYSLHETRPDDPKVENLRQAQLALLRGEATAAPTVERQRSVQTVVSAGSPVASVGLQKFKADPKAPFAHPYFWAPFILIGNWK